MGKHYVVLSFFKSNRIDSHFNSDRKTILFPCPYCWEQSTMCAITTNWSCESCSKYGTLFTLININNEEPIKGKIQIFEPDKERLIVNKLFEELLTQRNVNNESKILHLKNRVNKLLAYYEDNS